ncbi:Kinesin-like protein NACK1 [Apostasia shenzhenica]|uniref:Kinesin-like protein NACK1 n=1 Tax=Apostasia shenzhenica TaxID=1088818 RepID=A0A2I0B8S2_9ASPA|nr:Kinesin-like protein NACK1 [Apostasia shenzhenica]
MAGPSFSSSSRARSSSPFSHRRPLSSSYSSSSSSASSFMNGRLIPRSSPSSVSSHFTSSGGIPRSVTPSRGRYDPSRNRGPIGYVSADDVIVDAADVPSSGDSITVTVRFRPLSQREFQRGDEIAWYADGDKLVRFEYNPATAYAFDRVFGPLATSQVVYDVAARPVVKATMEGINGTVFAYGVTSSGKTHTMHGDQSSPGIIPLAIKDVFSIIQDVINDLLDPTGQNLRVREDAQGTYVEGIKEEVVLSPGHALSFIAAGEGSESSKTETTGLRRKEGSYINKSLLTLGTVIGKLSEGRATHVPYRDSKLTRLLQSSLSGHGLVSLICTVTPASSNMEETHNTLKFASRAKRVEIYASRNRIIDEKSLIKKYQREISSLKQELDQLKRGMLTGVNHEEIMSLKQKLQEGQVKMQSRLEEEEEAKAALMSRIQRLTKLILVSTKNTIPGCLGDLPSHQRRHSLCEDDKLGVLGETQPLIPEIEGVVGDPISDSLDQLHEKRQRPLSKFNEEQSSSGMTISDQIDLLEEQVKMVAGEIALSNSTLKRLLEQSADDPDNAQVQISKPSLSPTRMQLSSELQVQSLEREIEEKRKQMRVLEQRISESREASVANASLVEMQQTVVKLMTHCNEKGFELEIKTADNRILQEQLTKKCAENNELQEKLLQLQHQLHSVTSEMPSSTPENFLLEEIGELKIKLQYMEDENKKLNHERLQIVAQNSELLDENHRLSEEATYAKELASAAAAELKNLTEEVTKLSLQNARQAKELSAAQEFVTSRNSGVGIRKYSESRNDVIKLGRKGRPASRSSDISSSLYDDAGYWNPDMDAIKMELQARKQREMALESALAEKELLEEEYKRKFDESRKREAALENDLAGMWILVAKLKKGVLGESDLNFDARSSNGTDLADDMKENKHDHDSIIPKDIHVTDRLIKPINDQLNQNFELEPLLSRLKLFLLLGQKQCFNNLQNQVTPPISIPAYFYEII